MAVQTVADYVELSALEPLGPGEALTLIQDRVVRMVPLHTQVLQRLFPEPDHIFKRQRYQFLIVRDAVLVHEPPHIALIEVRPIRLPDNPVFRLCPFRHRNSLPANVAYHDLRLLLNRNEVYVRGLKLGVPPVLSLNRHAHADIFPVDPHDSGEEQGICPVKLHQNQGERRLVQECFASEVTDRESMHASLVRQLIPVRLRTAHHAMTPGRGERVSALLALGSQELLLRQSGKERGVLSIGVDVVHFPVILADYGIQVVQDVPILGLWKLEVFCLCHAAPPYYGRSRMLTAIYVPVPACEWMAPRLGSASCSLASFR